MDRLALSFKKVPSEYQDGIRSYIEKSLIDFNNYPDEDLITDKNRDIILGVTESFKKTLP